MIIAAALIHVIARTLGGRGSFAGYLKLVGFIALVGVVAVPLDLLDSLARLTGSARLELSLGEDAGARVQPDPASRSPARSLVRLLRIHARIEVKPRCRDDVGLTPAGRDLVRRPGHGLAGRSSAKE